MSMRDEYWARRAAARMTAQELTAQQRLEALSAPYRRAQANIIQQIRGIQEAYARRYGLSEDDMRKFLTEPADEKTLRRLAREIERMPEGPEKRRMEGQLNAPGTRHRISNLQAVREQVRAITEELSESEQKLVTDSLTRAVRESYLENEFDLQKNAGVLTLPQGISQRFISQALKEPWSGANYKTRIEGRYDDLAREVQRTVTTALMGGGTQAHLAEELSHEFRASFVSAKRLIATETCHVVNTAHLEGFRQDGVKEYRIIAIMDLLPCDVCQEQDMKIYPVEEKSEGTNAPPFHPNCRCSVSPVTDRKWLETMERRATDPVTGEIQKLAPGTTYKQWLEQLEKKYGKDKLDQLRAEKQRKTRIRNEAMQKKIDRESK